MALATATITADLADLIGGKFDARRTKVWVTTNVVSDTIVDTVGNKVRLGTGSVTLAADGTAAITVWVPGAGSNPASWQTYINVDYPDQGTRTRKTRTFGPYTITGAADLADLIDEQEVPPEYLSSVTTQLQGYVDAAEAAAAEAEAATGVVPATDTTPGIVQRATANEVATGTNATKFMTPATARLTYARARQVDVQTQGILPDGGNYDTQLQALLNAGLSPAFTPPVGGGTGSYKIRTGLTVANDGTIFDNVEGARVDWAGSSAAGGASTAMIHNASMTTPLTGVVFRGRGKWSSETQSTQGSLIGLYGDTVFEDFQVDRFGIACRVLALAGKIRISDRVRITGGPNEVGSAAFRYFGSGPTTTDAVDKGTYNAGTTYAARDYVVATINSGQSNAFQMAFISLQGSNVNHDPAASPTYWAPFDPTPGSGGRCGKAVFESTDDCLQMVPAGASADPWFGFDVVDFWYEGTTGESRQGKFMTAGLQAASGFREGNPVMTSRIIRSGWRGCTGKGAAFAQRAVNFHAKTAALDGVSIDVESIDCKVDMTANAQSDGGTALEARRGVFDNTQPSQGDNGGTETTPQAGTIGRVISRATRIKVVNPRATSVRVLAGAEQYLTDAELEIGRSPNGGKPIIESQGRLVMVRGRVNGTNSTTGQNASAGSGSNAMIALNSGTYRGQTFTDTNSVIDGVEFTNVGGVMPAVRSNGAANPRIRGIKVTPRSGITTSQGVYLDAATTGAQVEPGVNLQSLGSANRIVNLSTGAVLPADTPSGFDPVAFTGLPAGAAGVARTTVKTGAYTAVAGDLVPVDTTSSSITITLPTAPVNKSQVAVKHIIRGGTNTVTVACSGSDTINRASGVASITLTLLGQSALLQYDTTSTTWTVLSTDVPLSQTDLRYAMATDVAGKQDTSARNQPSGYAGLDSGGLVPASLLPSYVDDVLEFANQGAFPATGETGKIYVALDNNKTYRWSGSAYVEISASPGSTDAVPEGSTNLYFTNARAAAAAPVQDTDPRLLTTTEKTRLAAIPSLDSSGHFSLAVQRQAVRHMAALRRTNVVAETLSRTVGIPSSTIGPTSGKLTMFALYLLKDTVVSSITFATGATTAGAGMTHTWFALLDANMAQVAISADDTTATWAVNTERTLPMTAAYTVPADGLYYVALSVTATTMPGLVGTNMSAVLSGATPRLTGATATTYTLPSDVPAAGTPVGTINNLAGYAWVQAS